MIPASGFYEWHKTATKTRQPWNIFRAEGQPLALAGLWEHWTSADGDAVESCSIITTEANEFMAEIHDRIPVILDRTAWNLWLDPAEVPLDALTELLTPCPSDWLERTPVSTLVISVRNESPDCVLPVDTPRTLF